MRWPTVGLFVIVVLAGSCSNADEPVSEPLSMSDDFSETMPQWADVAGWMTGFELEVSPELVYPVVTSGWGLAPGTIRVDETVVKVPADIRYPDNCGLIVMIMNQWGGPGASASGCYVMVGVDDSGDAAWLRAFSSGAPIAWDNGLGWSELFEPVEEVTVEFIAFADGHFVIGPDELPLAVPVPPDTANSCGAAISDPELFELPLTIVRGTIDVATGSITRVFCDTFGID